MSTPMKGIQNQVHDYSNGSGANFGNNSSNDEERNLQPDQQQEQPNQQPQQQTNSNANFGAGEPGDGEFISNLGEFDIDRAIDEVVMMSKKMAGISQRAKTIKYDSLCTLVDLYSKIDIPLLVMDTLEKEIFETLPKLETIENPSMADK